MLLLAQFRVPARERVFPAWAGMRGAVPILLASLALDDAVKDAPCIDGLALVVVAASVSLQGITLRSVASALCVGSKEMHEH
jgi:cell volume regulation protein A